MLPSGSVTVQSQMSCKTKFTRQQLKLAWLKYAVFEPRIILNELLVLPIAVFFYKDI